MKSNMSYIDRLLRLGVSAICFFLALYYRPVASDMLISYTVIAVGVINGAVSLIGLCPVYMLVGINTNKSENNPE